MAGAYNDVLIVEAVDGGTFYAICECFEADVGDKVKMITGAEGRVEQVFHDPGNCIYPAVAAKNLVDMTTHVWKLSYKAALAEDTGD